MRLCSDFARRYCHVSPELRAAYSTHLQNHTRRAQSILRISHAGCRDIQNYGHFTPSVFRITHGASKWPSELHSATSECLQNYVRRHPNVFRIRRGFPEMVSESSSSCMKMHSESGTVFGNKKQRFEARPTVPVSIVWLQRAMHSQSRLACRGNATVRPYGILIRHIKSQPRGVCIS